MAPVPPVPSTPAWASQNLSTPSWTALLGPGIGGNPLVQAQNAANAQFNPLINQILQQQVGNQTASAAAPQAVQQAYNPYLQQVRRNIGAVDQNTATSTNVLARLAQELGGGQGTNAAVGNWAGFNQAQGQNLHTQALQGLTNAQKMVAQVQQQRQGELAAQSTQLQQALAQARSQKGQAATDAYYKLLQMQANLQSQAISDAGALQGQGIQKNQAAGNLALQGLQWQSGTQSLELQNITAQLSQKMGEAQLAQLKASIGVDGNNFLTNAPAGKVAAIDTAVAPFIDKNTGKIMSGMSSADMIGAAQKQLRIMFPSTSTAGLKAMDTLLRNRLQGYFKGATWTPPQVNHGDVLNSNSLNQNTYDLLNNQTSNPSVLDSPYAFGNVVGTGVR